MEMKNLYRELTGEVDKRTADVFEKMNKSLNF